MSEHPLINLLVVDSSSSEVERAVQALRDAEFSVELIRSDNESETQNVIHYKPLDMVVVRPGEGLPSIEWLRGLIQSAGKDIPILAALDDQPAHSPGAILRAGADNAFHLNEPEHLVLIVRKELRHLALRQQTHSLETRIQETETRSQALLDASWDAIAYIHEGCHIYANPAYVKLFGYANQDDLASLALIEMFAADDRDPLKRFLRDSMKQGDPLEPVELTGLKLDQSTFPVRLGCTPMQMDEEPCLQIVIHAAAPPPSIHQRLADFTTHDVYTGIYNRKFFTQRIEEILNGSTRAAGGVLYILLTDYRSVSERLGLEAIDQITVDLANVLQKLVSKDEVVARFSDAVFTVYTPVSARHSIMQLGERISTAIKDHVSHAAHKLITTASAIGICLIQDNHENAYQILGHADRACETARKMGPNHVQIFTGRVERTGEDKREEELVELIRDAISGERLNLLYQPIASFQGTGEERYRIQLQILNRDQEPLAMAILEPVAERRGLMFAMDKWVIMRGLEKLAERYRGGKTPPSLFIPISGNSMQDGGLADWLAGRLKDTGLTGDFVVAEITEEHAEQYFKEAKALRERMRQMGCRFSLSQFGGKENSERILTYLQPDYIKIDSSLIEKLSKARDTASREAMAALTEKAQEMETKVVAEGISSAPQMASIWQYGVTLVQGDMVQEPGPEMNFDFHMFAG